jgi:hypothetical protein
MVETKRKSFNIFTITSVVNKKIVEKIEKAFRVPFLENFLIIK